MDEVERLVEAISRLSAWQRDYVARIVAGLNIPVQGEACPDSDIATPDFLEAMADVLRGHHVTSSRPLGKELFEHALAAVLVDLGHAAKLSPRGIPGADLEVDGFPWSLKTEGSQTIRRDQLHISKMMELGKGAWQTEQDLGNLRNRMLDHLGGYDRIFSLRYLSGAKSRRDQGEHEYELVEIPKTLLQRSAGQPCSMHSGSRQTPKPGVCRVVGDDGRLEFELYFDGGTERKLQIRKLRIDLCVVHARWKFSERH